jgi:hypothetical protein
LIGLCTRRAPSAPQGQPTGPRQWINDSYEGQVKSGKFGSFSPVACHSSKL